MQPRARLRLISCGPPRPPAADAEVPKEAYALRGIPEGQFQVTERRPEAGTRLLSNAKTTASTARHRAAATMASSLRIRMS